MIGLDFVPERSIPVCIAGAAKGGSLPNPAGDLAMAGSCWWQRMLSQAQGAEYGKTYRYAAHRALEGGGGDDGIASIPGGLNKAAAAKVAASLVSRKRMRKVRSKPDVPVWREDEEGRGTSLVITREGREAIGLEDGENDSSNLSLGAEETGVQRRQPSFQKCLNRIDEPRPGSKQAVIATMLSRKAGATLEALVDATGWLPHTTRAALTGLRKRGYMVLLERQDGKPSLYRIAFSHDRKAA